MYILESGRRPSPTDTARYSTLTKTTILRDIFKTGCRHIMVFFSPKTSSMKVSSNTAWLGAKASTFRDPKLSRASLKKINHREIVSKILKHILLLVIMKKTPGAMES